MNHSRQTCSRCIYPVDHPFGLTLDHDGICSGCRVHEEKTTLDWGAREVRLREIIIPSILGKRRHRDYDCVVPVRGSPEYFKVLDIVVNHLGLHPLVVCYNSQFHTTVGIENLDRLREAFDVDLLHYTSNPIIYRKLVREALVHLGSHRWPFLAGESQFPVQIAVEREIPLVIWPVHQPTEQVGAHSYQEEPEMSRRSRQCYDLLGREPEDFLTVQSLLRPFDIEDLVYPSDADLLRIGVRGLYLSNFYPWDARRYSEEMVVKYGARCARQPRTFDTYDRIDDITYMTVHDLNKQYHVGYSRVTDHLCREIRFGRISRSDALPIAAWFTAQSVDDAEADFSRWLGMQPDALPWLRHNFTANPIQSLPTNPPGMLSQAQQAFIDSYQTNALPILESPAYILYGKGLVV